MNEYMRKELGRTEEYTTQIVHNKVGMLTSKSKKFCATCAKPPPTGSGSDPEHRIDLAAATA